jgi:hypothetical protein
MASRKSSKKGKSSKKPRRLRDADLLKIARSIAGTINREMDPPGGVKDVTGAFAVSADKHEKTRLAIFEIVTEPLPPDVRELNRLVQLANRHLRGFKGQTTIQVATTVVTSAGESRENWSTVSATTFRTVAFSQFAHNATYWGPKGYYEHYYGFRIIIKTEQ